MLKAFIPYGPRTLEMVGFATIKLYCYCTNTKYCIVTVTLVILQVIVSIHGQVN